MSDISKTLSLLKTHDFVWLHIKGTDIAAHDRNYRAKTEFIERVDREIFAELVNLENTLVVVTSDHITSSQSGEHVLGYVPILMYNAGERDGVRNFDEESVRAGALGIIGASDLMEKLLALR